MMRDGGDHDESSGIMGRVAGKVCIVTGASSGLGAADARRLAEEGASVVLTDVAEAAGRQLAAELPGALFLPHDVRDEARWIAVIAETVQRFGRLDVLVNNAGIVRFADIETSTLEEFRLVNAVMLEGTFLGCKHAIPAMAQGGGGSIVNVSSTSALCGYAAIPAYTAAKGAIIAMTRSIAVHCQDKGNGIRCNAIVPGAHDTPMIAAAFTENAGDAKGMEQSTGRGLGRPVDVANLVLFLASDESRQITGTQMIIDGGETMR
jgi:3(or 17)beta-hydroxysteroid dehydrogenase